LFAKLFKPKDIVRGSVVNVKLKLLTLYRCK